MTATTPTTPIQSASLYFREGNDPGVRCQLLNPIEEDLRLGNREGVVFKDMDAPFSPGRPYSGGPQLKLKFVESASFVVTGINAKRSHAQFAFADTPEGPTLTLTVPAAA